MGGVVPMIEPIVVHCDGPGCKATKREVNRWWVLNLGVKHIDGDGRKPIEGFSEILYMMPWHRAKEADIKLGKHACSRSCAQKIIEQWMSAVESPCQEVIYRTDGSAVKNSPPELTA